MKNVIIIK